MSKYIKTIPLDRVEKISIELGRGRSPKTVKADTGCDYVINGGFYDFATNQPVAHLKVAGKVLSGEQWGSWGYAWDTGPDISMVAVPRETTKDNYITCVPLLTPWDGICTTLDYPAALGGKRGRTALALTEDKLILYCSGDGTKDAATPEYLRDQLWYMGARTALMLDSGGSSQCDFGAGEAINTGRKVHNYICVWSKTKNEKEDNESNMKEYTVCLDPGHGPDSPNKSPDGTYYEHEFAWDLAQRIKPILEGRGVKVVVTRTKDTHPSLTARAAVSNDAGADLLVSLHSNAYGTGGWTSPSGLMIYTSAAGETAGRNKAARAILARMEAGGVTLHKNSLAHEGFTVLVKAIAPAVLIEYGFHTNQTDVELLKSSDYRDELARATADGICDYLGVAILPTPPAETQEDKPDDWAVQAWKKAKAAGVLDGTRPREAVTRQELAVVLERLGLLK